MSGNNNTFRSCRLAFDGLHLLCERQHDAKRGVSRPIQWFRDLVLCLSRCNTSKRLPVWFLFTSQFCVFMSRLMKFCLTILAFAPTTCVAVCVLILNPTHSAQLSAVTGFIVPLSSVSVTSVSQVSSSTVAVSFVVGVVSRAQGSAVAAALRCDALVMVTFVPELIPIISQCFHIRLHRPRCRQPRFRRTRDFLCKFGLGELDTEVWVMILFCCNYCEFANCLYPCHRV